MRSEIKVQVKNNEIDLKNRVAGLMMLCTAKGAEDLDVDDVEGTLVLKLTGQEPDYIIEKLIDALNKAFGEQITIL
ncbi:MAG: hypothetical protein ACRCXX_14425 [Cetobacterium sp.]|uniref:hypothetical protein n=1 Tax=Cetobacterium sp. TaxID=2071632 RepID=UPI003F3CF4DA